MNKKWTQKEIEFLKLNYTNYTIMELANIFNCSYNSIRKCLSYRNIKLSEEDLKKRLKFAIIEFRKKHNGLFKEDNPNWKGGISKNNYHYKKLQKQRYPEKIRAREILSLAIKKRKIIKKPCEICGEQISQAHHEDYSKPLDVIWLCRKHHREIHGNLH